MRLLVLFFMLPFVALTQDPIGTHHFSNQMLHSEPVLSVAFSPDGRTIVSGSMDNTLKIWEAQTGTEIRTLKGHSSTVTSVAFSPDGRTIVSGSTDKTLKLWDAQSGIEIHSLEGYSSYVNSVAFSPDGKTIVSGSTDKALKLWDAHSGTEIRTLNGHSSTVTSVAFSPDGRTIVSGSTDKTLKLWDAQSGIEIHSLEGHSSYVNSVAFSPDGKTIISGSLDKTLKLWDAQSGIEIRTLKGHSSYVNSVAFSPDGKTIISGGDENTIKIWDARSGKETRSLKGHTPYNNYLFSLPNVNSVAFSPDGKTIISGSNDHTIKQWDFQSGKEIRLLKGHTSLVYSITFSPDGRTIASGGYGINLKLWDAQSGKEIRSLNGHDGSVYSITFSPDGRTIASASNNTLKLWDAQSGKEIRSLNNYTSYVLSVAFSPNGRIIISGGADYSIELWDTKSRKVIRSLDAPSYNYCLAFSPDGKTIVSGSADKTIKLWDVQSGEEIRSLSGHNGYVYSVAFSSDGKTIISGSADSTIKLWDVQSGEEIRSLNGHNGSVHSVAFRPDGRTIVSGSEDMSVKVWEVATGKEVKSIELNYAVNHVSFTTTGDSIRIGTVAYWLSLPLEKPLVQQIAPTTTAAQNYFAAHFWSNPVFAQNTDNEPARFTQKVVNLAGVWQGNFSLSGCEVKLYLNKKEVAAGGKTFSSEKKIASGIISNRSVTLNEGSNVAQWQLSCANGYTTYSDIKYLYYDDINQPNLFVYAFGVEASDLKFTSNDAQYIKQLFVKQKGVLFKEVYATAFTGVQTNAAAIKQTMERLGNDTRIRTQDVVLIFFSSHGLPSSDESFIIQARDYDPYAPNNTTLRYQQDVLAFLEKRPSKRVVLLDACFSGGKAHPDISKAVAETPPGWVMLSSSTGNELSFEHTDWQHGSFTYAIQQAIEQGKADKDNNGQITLGELYDFLAENVPAQNRSKNLPEQHPTIKKEGVEDFVIYVLK